MQRLSIDLGYGDTKVVVGDKIFKFASAIEKRKESQVEYDSDNDDVYLFKGRKYRVGDRALVNAISTRGFNFLLKYGALLIYHAIELSGLDKNEPLEIIIGLSILNWKEKDIFIDTLRTINVNDSIISPKIHLMAQGQGIYLDYVGKKDGLVCVADIGYNTFDFLVFEDGKPRQDLSYATNKGANEIITELQTKLKKRFNFDATEQIAKDTFINGYIMHYGEKIDLSDEIDESKEDYAEYILDEMKNKGVDLLRSATAVIFSGGGAYFLNKSKNPSNVVFSSLPYEYANVRGYNLLEIKEGL